MATVFFLPNFTGSEMPFLPCHQLQLPNPLPLSQDTSRFHQWEVTPDNAKQYKNAKLELFLTLLSVDNYKNLKIKTQQKY